MQPRTILMVAAICGLGALAAGAAALDGAAREASAKLFDAAEARFAVTLDQVRRRLEARLTLGAPLQALTGVDADFTQAMSDPHIQAIEMFDRNGVILLSTDVSFVGDLAAAADMDAFGANRADVDAAAHWAIDHAEDLDPKIGFHLRNAHDEIVGAVTLSFDRAPVLAAVAQDQRIGWALVLIAAIASAIVGYFIAGGAASGVATRASALDQLASGEAANDRTPAEAASAFAQLKDADELLDSLSGAMRSLGR
ncbi:MAG: hypothetical protein AAF360_09755 [Pseudomonadota bacterium]